MMNNTYDVITLLLYYFIKFIIKKVVYVSEGYIWNLHYTKVDLQHPVA